MRNMTGVTTLFDDGVKGLGGSDGNELDAG
jgi:hypothetical protein